MCKLQLMITLHHQVSRRAHTNVCIRMRLIALQQNNIGIRGRNRLYGHVRQWMSTLFSYYLAFSDFLTGRAPWCQRRWSYCMLLVKAQKRGYKILCFYRFIQLLYLVSKSKNVSLTQTYALLISKKAFTQYIQSVLIM